jgi:hypothetical protein
MKSEVDNTAGQPVKSGVQTIDWDKLGGAIPGFDCVKMKDEGAALVRARVEGMTLEEELAYWQQRSAELKAKRF